MHSGSGSDPQALSQPFPASTSLVARLPNFFPPQSQISLLRLPLMDDTHKHTQAHTCSHIRKNILSFTLVRTFVWQQQQQRH